MSSAESSAKASLLERVRRGIRDIPDFPAPGILFRDITPLLQDATLFRDVTDAMALPFRAQQVTHVAGVESRGFVLAAPVAQRLGAGFIPVRKQGKLPWKTARRSYGLEYGTDQLEIHADACPPGSRVLVVDDVLATGGTARAAAELIGEIGGAVVGFSFLIVLDALDGTAQLDGCRVETLIRF